MTINLARLGKMRLGLLIPLIACTATVSAVEAQSLAKPIGSVADWFGPDQYPVDALRRSEQGRVVASVTIDPTGKPIACDIKQSSGSASLDKGTCDIVLAKGSYEPSRDKAGRAIQAHIPLSVVWALPEDNAPIDVGAPGFKMRATDLTITVRVAPDGTVLSCDQSTPAGPIGTSPSNCAQWAPGTKVMGAMTRNGRPIGARIVHHLTIETTFDP